MSDGAREIGDEAPPARRRRVATADVPPEPRRRRRWPWVLLLLVVVALASSPWWGRLALRRLAYFRVRKIEVVGVRYLPAAQVARVMRIDTLASVFDDLEPVARRVRLLPQVRDVRVDRQLPGTLVVTVTENLPVALVPTARGFRIYDPEGRALPIDPSRTPVDAPILAAPDPALLRLLGEIRSVRPALFARIDDLRRVGRDEVLFHLAALPVRAMADLAIERLDEIAPVEQDLARRRVKVAELDLRFRDQVIARLQ